MANMAASRAPRSRAYCAALDTCFALARIARMAWCQSIAMPHLRWSPRRSHQQRCSNNSSSNNSCNNNSCNNNKFLQQHWLPWIAMVNHLLINHLHHCQLQMQQASVVASEQLDSSLTAAGELEQEEEEEEGVRLTVASIRTIYSIIAISIMRTTKICISIRLGERRLTSILQKLTRTHAHAPIHTDPYNTHTHAHTIRIPTRYKLLKVLVNNVN